MTARRKVLIVYPYDNIGTNPTMVAIVEGLGHIGVGVDVACVADSEDSYPAFKTSNPDVSMFSSPEFLRWESRSKIGQPGISSASLVRRTARFLRDRVLPKRETPATPSVESQLSSYSQIIGVDPTGIAAAHRLSQLAKLPLAYVSFELLLSDEAVGGYEERLKQAERRATQHCDLVLIQDEERGEIFARDNGISMSRLCFVPVAPVDAVPARTSYLRNHLKIEADKKIVLFQGTIAPWSGLHEWEDLVAAWPKNIVLVIHSRNRLNARMSKYMSRLTASGRVFCTDNPVSADELPLLTASADVGLVSYHPSPDSWYHLTNLKAIGLASGKFSYFMMCGVPVLVNTRTSLSSIVEAADLGGVYGNAAQSAESLKQIFESWDTKSGNSRAYFENRLDPVRSAGDFVMKLMGLL